MTYLLHKNHFIFLGIFFFLLSILFIVLGIVVFHIYYAVCDTNEMNVIHGSEQ